jgi:hypothetical protein
MMLSWAPLIKSQHKNSLITFLTLKLAANGVYCTPGTDVKQILYYTKVFIISSSSSSPSSSSSSNGLPFERLAHEEFRQPRSVSHFA